MSLFTLPFKGKIDQNAPLASYTWFRVGGAADIFFRPQDEDDLRLFLQNYPHDAELTVIGVASNLLIRDGGIAEAVLRLGRDFAVIKQIDDTKLYAGAAALDMNVAKFAADKGLAGLEFLRGIPGNIGGAIRMNAGAYTKELKDILVEVHAIDRRGEKHVFTADTIPMTYRHCHLPSDLIFTGAVLQGAPDNSADITARMNEIMQKREDSQPVKSATGGSTFKNPDGHSAWKLIDAAGCRGLQVGGAEMSVKHCNFMINTGTATAADLENLGEEVRKRVFDHSGISLEWEIKRLGRP